MSNQVSTKKVSTALGLAFLGYAISLLLNTIVARILSINHFGDFAVAVSFGTLLSSGIDLGGAWAIMKFIPIYRHKQQATKIKGYIVFYGSLIVILGALLLAASFATYHTFNHFKLDHQHPIYYAVLIVPFLCFINLFAGLYLSSERLILGATSKNCFYPAINIGFILTFYLINHSLDSYQAVLITALAAATTCLALAIHVNKTFPLLFSKKTHPTYRAKEWLKISLPGMLNAFSLCLSTQVNLFMLEILAQNENQVSFFAASHRLSSIIFILSTGISMIFLPKISSAMLNGHQASKMLFKQYSISSTLLSLPIITLLCVFSKTWLSLFGSNYVDAQIVVQLIAASYFASMVFLPIENFLYYGGHERMITWGVIIRLSINLGLNIYLVPSMGASGSALATLIARLVCSMVFLYIFYTRIWRKKTSP